MTTNPPGQSDISMTGSDPMTKLRRGQALMAAGRKDEAILEFADVVAADPNDITALALLATALIDLTRYDHAEAVLSAAPDQPWAHALRAVCMAGTSQYEACVDEYEYALRQAPDFHDARFGLAQAQLTLGRFTEGWQDFAARPVRREMAGRATRPFWDGQSAPDATLLIQHEGGAGDTIQMCRFVRRAMRRVGRVFVRVPPSLFRLMADLQCDVVLDTVPAPRHDFVCAMMDLPGLFATDAETLPGPVPYLHAERPEMFQARLAGMPRPWIGLCWAGAPSHHLDHERSISPSQLDNLLGIRARFISLQIPPATEHLPLAVQDWTREIRDFADTANLVSALDLVITVDTAVAHLAGALGRPVWLLNRYDTDWRWLLDREDSPWYPTMRIFRQPARGDWESVLARVKAELTSAEAKQGGFVSRLARILGRG